MDSAFPEMESSEAAQQTGEELLNYYQNWLEQQLQVEDDPVLYQFLLQMQPLLEQLALLPEDSAEYLQLWQQLDLLVNLQQRELGQRSSLSGK